MVEGPHFLVEYRLLLLLVVYQLLYRKLHAKELNLSALQSVGQLRMEQENLKNT